MASRGGVGPDSLGESELKMIMDAMGCACDVVRVVDPSTFEARTLDADGEFGEPYACFSALHSGRRCENCISMRAAGEGRPVSKFEFCDGDAYFISARPIVLDGRAHTIEMVQRVSDDVGFQQGLEDLREHVQDETDGRFIDGFTGAYSRNYFDEGLQSVRGRKLAMLKVSNLSQINGREGYPAGDLVLKRIAHEILANTRVEDSVVRYEGDTFIVQFEDMGSEVYPIIVERIAKAANSVCVEEHPGASPQVTVAAVDEGGTFGELAERALELLEEAEVAGERLVVSTADSQYRSHARARRARPRESLRHGPDRLIIDVDELTGLRTSTSIRAYLQRLLEAGDVREGGYSVIYLDVVNFKQFNRTYGRPGGDVLIKYIGDCIRGEFPHAQAARMRGDVFLVVADVPDVRERIERLRLKVASYQKRISLELKAGVKEIDGATHDAAAAIDLAKVACESIKGLYDLGVRFYDSELDQEVSMNEYVVNNIDRAIEEGQIKVYFQPIIRAMTGRVCDYECLCRWEDPVHGLLPPASFISALERFHLINKVDVCVVRQACAHQARLMEQGKPLVPVSVNLSRLDFQLEDMFAVVEDAVEGAGIPRGMLNIEVTESALDGGGGEFDAQLERFRAAGYEVWMDDFGSGYSSLNLLKDYRFDTLKMDMAFLEGFENNPKSREIIVTIVDMAKKLGIRTLVEGVETQRQYRFLQRIGCEMLQGFYFSKPLPYDEHAFDEFTMEESGERAYFDALGGVNLLGLPTDDGSDVAVGYVTESESRSAPMALVEYRGGAYGYLSANEEYLKLLADAGASTLDELQEAMSQGEYSVPSDLAARLDQMRWEDGEDVRAFPLQGRMRRVQVRHVATAPGAHAYVVVPAAPM